MLRFDDVICVRVLNGVSDLNYKYPLKSGVLGGLYALLISPISLLCVYSYHCPSLPFLTTQNLG